MAKIRHNLAESIMKDHFGDIVTKVSSYLVLHGERSLKDICSSVHLSNEEVKKCLGILIQHHIVLPSKTVKEKIVYRALLENILKRKRYQRYVYCVKAKYGDIAELIVETLLLRGSDTISRLSTSVAERLVADDGASDEADVNPVLQKFSDLITSQFVRRVANPNRDRTTDNVEVERLQEESFTVPKGIGVKRKKPSSDSDVGEPSAKKGKTESSSSSEDQGYVDDGIYWHINFDMFEKVLVDQLITDAVTEQFDQAAGKIVSTILKLVPPRTTSASSTESVSLFELEKKLPGIPKLSREEIRQYLGLLCEEKSGGFVSKVDENSGGTYCIDISGSMKSICHCACSQIIQERFGSKACRVFRLLYIKKNLEQKQISESAMIPFKEVKELLYKLFEERFVKIQEISKSSDYAPSRTFYLFSIDLPEVARLLLNTCYQTLANLMGRREATMVENKRLVEKNEKLDGILSALQAGTAGGGANEEQIEQVVAELEELITPSEKQQVEKMKLDLARLEQGEIQVEETIFILQTYLMFH